MKVHDELEVLANRRKASRDGYEELTQLLMSAVRRAADEDMDVDAIATHAGLSVATVRDMLGRTDLD